MENVCWLLCFRPSQFALVVDISTVGACVSSLCMFSSNEWKTVFSAIILIKLGQKTKRIFSHTISSLYTHSTIPWDQADIFLHTVTSKAENWVTYVITGMNSSFCFTQRFRDRFTIALPHCKFHWGVSADVTLQACNAPFYHMNMLMTSCQPSMAALNLITTECVCCLFGNVDLLLLVGDTQF